ncbi:MAG: hypothetical protein B7Y98_04940 [Sphingomonas sp. 32-62-10]|nr:MAG: hypothetical protein B7Z43_04645 [Sphingomonas sp. 12-62-6]OYX39289.1 MAG: hypothetical protein B7Y98_04940 [Sphingomonas sp. 32-62-10]
MGGVGSAAFSGVEGAGFGADEAAGGAGASLAGSGNSLTMNGLARSATRLTVGASVSSNSNARCRAITIANVDTRRNASAIRPSNHPGDAAIAFIRRYYPSKVQRHNG